MSSLESMIASAGEAPMADSLEFTLPPASTAVVDRRQHLRAYPTSASTLTPTGTRTCRIRLGGDDFVDASSIRLMYTINNLAHIPRALSSEWALGCMGSGVSAKQRRGVRQHPTVWDVFTSSTVGISSQWRSNSAKPASRAWQGLGVWPQTPPTTRSTANSPSAALHGDAQGLRESLSSGKLLPTRYAPLELELTLNPVTTDWVAGGKHQLQHQNVQLLYDAYVLDEAVQESFYKALLSNRVLSIPTMTVYQTVQSIPAGSTSFSFSAVRAFSRLSHVWLTFSALGQELAASSALRPSRTTSALHPSCKMARAQQRAQHRSPYWPDTQPASTIPELFYMFQKALPGVPNITRDNFETGNCFTSASTCGSARRPNVLDFDAFWRSSESRSHQFERQRRTECWMTLFAFSVTAVRESGVTLLT